jgi:hypothetical protein
MSMLFGTTILWDAFGALLSARAASGCDGSILRGLDRLCLLMQMV